MSDKSLDQQLAELLAAEAAKDKDSAGDERLFTIKLSHLEMSACRQSLQMLHQMGSMVAIQENDEAESEEIERKNLVVRKLIRRIINLHDGNCSIDHESENEE